MPNTPGTETHAGPAAPAGSAGSADPALSWAATRSLMREDFERYRPFMGEHAGLARRIFWILLPAPLSLFAYRIYRHLYLRGWRNLAQLLFLASRYVTGMDIPPSTSIGGGCLLGHGSIVLCGRIGRHFTMMGHGGVGGGFDSTDIGAGPGLPVVGDHVTLAIRAIVLGPVRIGDGVRLGPNAAAMRDVPPGAVVAAPLSRVLHAAQAGPEGEARGESIGESRGGRESTEAHDFPDQSA